MKSLTELLPLHSPITICDIGAALDETPNYQGLVKAGLAKLVGFEPTLERCQQLNQHYGEPHRFYPYFIGDGGEHKFYETNTGHTSSLFEPNHELNERFIYLAELMQVTATHQVKTTRIDDVEGLDDCDFLKIDVQGAELMTFRNGQRLLARTLLVQTEVLFVHHYKDQPLFSDVDAELRAQGFQFHTLVGVGKRAFKPIANNDSPSKSFHQWIWADAAYVRDWMKLGELTVEKLRKYAVLMHDVLGSYDLCHLVLEELARQEGVDWAHRYRQWMGVTGAPAGPASHGG